MPTPTRAPAAALLAVLTLSLGCDRCSEPKAPQALASDPAPPAPTAPAANDPAAAAPVPAPPAATGPAPTLPVATILREIVSLEPGGPAVPLNADARTTVDPAATFRVELSTPVPDARLVLLDASDALVAAEGTHEVGSTTKLTLAPASPLVPGSRYTLRLDGAVTRDLHASDGRLFAPLAHPLLAAGTPPPREAKPAPKKKPRSRR